MTLLGCAANDQGRDGRYAGAVDTEEGVCSPAGGRSDGSLLVRGETVVFTPDQGVLTLQGRIDPVGHVAASAAGPGADHKPFVSVFEGDLRNGRVTGRYATPRCRASVRLGRVN